MWADSESEIDYLDYFGVSELVFDMVTDDAMLTISREICRNTGSFRMLGEGA